MQVGTMKLCLKSGPQYYTSRGESLENNAPRYDEKAYLISLTYGDEEYAYIWTVNNKWVCRKMNQFDDDKQPEREEIPEGELAA